MNLQDQQLRQASETLMRDIDFEILADVMVRFGWHLVELDRYTDNHHAIDVREWVAANCQGEHRSHGASWLFKEQSDAVLFKLRWV